MDGQMMDFQLTLPHLLKRAETYFGAGEIVSRQADKSFHRTTYRDTMRRARQLAVALGTLGLERGDRVVDMDGLAQVARGDALVSVDPSRPLGRLERTNGTSLPGHRDIPRARAAMAAEALGVAQRVLELGVQHAKTREQFGKPIGVYQAVSHQLADTYADVELARSLVYWAAWCVAEDDEQAPVAAAAAKSFAAEAAVAACERSIQVHGGTGFTWEHPLHRFYKRALWLEGFGSRPAELRGEVTDALLGVTVGV